MPPYENVREDQCLAFIVGPNLLQNTLFAAYIKAHSHWECRVVSCLPTAESQSVGDIRQTAVLYDCFGLEDAALEGALEEMEALPPEWSLVLFNLSRQTGIEKKALETGVHGFFYGDDPVENLLKGIGAIFGGEFWVSRRKMADLLLENCFRFRHRQVAPHVYPHGLTRREVELLGLLALGASNGSIAEKLFISPHTVRTHFNHIFSKISVTSRLEASVWASKNLFEHRD